MADNQLMEDTLAEIHALGWRVAEHHEFEMRGETHTSWVFTHDCGMWLKAAGPLQSQLLVLQMALGDAKNHKCNLSKKERSHA